MEKYFELNGKTAEGRPLIHLVEPGSGYGLQDSAELTKTASGEHMAQVIELVESIQPQPNRLYLVNSALGAGEWVGFNLRGDWFTERGLVHTPPEWDRIPLWDIEARRRAASTTEHVPGWGDLAWGYPTFYNASRFQHHANRDPSKARGFILGAFYDPRMHRVVLVSELVRDLCALHGGLDVYERAAQGEFPDTSMGCFPAGTSVSMLDGTRKPIEEIVSGDRVLTHRGRACTVQETYTHVHEGLFVIESLAIPTLYPTAEHPFYVIPVDQARCTAPKTHNYGRAQRACVGSLKGVKKGCAGCSTVPEYAPEWRRADELEEGDFLLSPAPMGVEDSGLTRELARLLGYYASGGSIQWYYPKVEGKRQIDRRVPGGVCFTFARDEVRYFEEIERLCLTLGLPEPSLWFDAEKNAVRISLFDAGFAEMCLGLVGLHAKEKRLSPSLMCAPPEIQKEFIGAYLNGDGGCLHGAGYISTANEQLALQLQVMLIRCGIVSSLSTLIHNGKSSTVTAASTVEYQLWLGVLGGYQLAAFSDLPFRQPIKVLSQRWAWTSPEGVAYVASPVVSVSHVPSWSGRVYNFSVEEDESYVVGGVAVHNCKVPYDRCSIDNHLARNPSEYCEHVRRGALPPYGMRAILPDGRMCGVYNDYPRFFDDSFVFIGAERSAKVMANVTKMVRGNRSYSARLYAPGEGSRDLPSREVLADVSALSSTEQGARLGNAVARVFNSRIRGSTENRAAENISQVLSEIPTQGDAEAAALQHAQETVRNSAALKDRTITPDEYSFWEGKAVRTLRSSGVSTAQQDRALALLRNKLDRFGGEKLGSLAKWAELIKRIPVPSSTQSALLRDHVGRMSPVIPRALVDQCSASPTRLWDGLGALGHLGVVLRPSEFQECALNTMGEHHLAEHCERTGLCFAPTPLDVLHEPRWLPSAPRSDFLQQLLALLGPALQGRSFAPTIVAARIISPPKVVSVRVCISRADPVLNQVSQMYNDYRTGLLTKEPDWGYVPSVPTSATLSDKQKVADAATTISSLLLHLAYW